MRDKSDEFAVEVDTNDHICTAKNSGAVEKALTDQGFSVSIDDRVTDAKVLEVPEAQAESAIAAVEALQAKHPEFGIAIRTDKYSGSKRR